MVSASTTHHHELLPLGTAPQARARNTVQVSVHLQSGSQPSLACHTSSCSGGTLASMWALCCR